MLDRIAGSAYFSNDAVDTRMLSVFSFSSIVFSKVNLMTVNNIGYYTQRTDHVKSQFQEHSGG